MSESNKILAQKTKVAQLLVSKEESNPKDEVISEHGTIAKQIVDLVMERNPVLFRNEINSPFVRVPIDDHWETYPIQSSRLRQLVVHLYFQKTRKPPKNEYVKQALDVLGSWASFEGEQHRLANRVAERENTFWYDLSDASWRAVKVSVVGWEVIDNPPILFNRFKHQEQQTTPTKGGTLLRLLDFINITDESQQLLLLVYLVSCFIPNISHPVPILYGSQGSAKSTFLRVIRRLVDPSAVELLAFPTRKEELVQQLSHHWMAPYDNISYLPEWLSDTICRGVTGEGFTKRELYSDDEDVVYTFRRCVALDGINIAATKADLLDRSILFGLERIQPECRRDEDAFWEEFTRERPAILGAVFDVLTKAMSIRPTMKLTQLPRMADFALWGCAIAEALGHSRESFLMAYKTNIDRQNEEAIHEHPVAAAVVSLLESRDEWSGSPTDLLGELSMVAEEQKLDTRQKLWPKAAQALTRRLNEAKTNLEMAGITISVGSRKHDRHITISHRKDAVGTDAPSVNNVIDGADDTSGTSPHGQEELNLIREHLDPNAHFIS